MTRNCPVGLAAVRKKLAIGFMSAAALVISALGLAVRPSGAPKAPETQVHAGEQAASGYWQAAMDWLCGKQAEAEPAPTVGRIAPPMMGVVAPSSPPPPSGKP